MSATTNSANFVLKAGFSPTTCSSDFANRTLIIFESGERLSYNDMNTMSGQVAECLRMIYHIKKGDRVLCRTSKNNSVIFYLAVLRVGAIYVPLNPLYTHDETQHFLETVEPRLFVTCNLSADSGFHEIFTGTTVIDETVLSEQANAAEPWLDVEPVTEEDVAVLLFTSGTTGKSKGAATSHGVLHRNALKLVNTWKFTTGDVLLHMLPFYHVHGMLVAFHCTIFSKSCTIFLPKFDVAAALKHFPSSTVFMGVPTFYSRLLESKEFTKETAAKMRLFVCGSAPLTQNLFEEFRERTGGRTILQRFGMTEANAITTSPYEESERTFENVGKPFPGIELKIAEGTSSILVRSRELFSGYWKEPEKTKKEFTDDGFFNTGDVGYIDEKGFLILNGRSKDVIISGGLNVYPIEVENVIDGTSEVVESAIIGVPHSDFGEAVVAVCVRKSEMSAIEAEDQACAERIKAVVREKLAPYKRPKRWIFVEALPRNFLGKVQKNVMRDQYRDLFTKS